MTSTPTSASSSSSLEPAGLVCLVMSLLTTIATMFIPIEENTYWESIEEPSSPAPASASAGALAKLREHSHSSHSISPIASLKDTFSFFFTIFCFYLFNSLLTFSLIQIIFTSSHKTHLSTSYWILSLLITQATMIGSTLLTSVLISAIGKRNTYLLTAILISLRGALLSLLFSIFPASVLPPLTLLLFTHLLEGYSLGLLSVLVIIDCEVLSRASASLSPSVSRPLSLSSLLRAIRAILIITTAAAYLIAFFPFLPSSPLLVFTLLSTLSILASLYLYPSSLLFHPHSSLPPHTVLIPPHSSTHTVPVYAPYHSCPGHFPEEEEPHSQPQSLEEKQPQQRSYSSGGAGGGAGTRIAPASAVRHSSILSTFTVTGSPLALRTISI
jgi:hypothetical protein